MYASHRKSVVPRKAKDPQPSNSLDFERVVNSYSIKAERARLINRFTSENEKENRPRRLHVALMDTIMLRGGQNSPGTSEILEEASFDLRDSSTSDKLGHYDDSEPFVQITEDAGHIQSLSPNERTLLVRNKTARFDLNHSENTVYNLFPYSGRSVIRWVLTCLTGIITGLLAIIILFSVENLGHFRVACFQHISANGGASALGMSFFLFATYSATLALVSSLLTLNFAPGAAASGIPEVKAYLNGVRTPKFADLKLLLVKTVGTILSVSSGLAIGPEGPLVHLGAIIGALVTQTRWLHLKTLELGKRYPILRTLFGWEEPNDCRSSPSLWSKLMHHLTNFRSDESRRDFISIGVGSGFAAAFGAPVGGVLFSMEEASSFFAHQMLLKTLVGATLASFCIACYHGDLSKYSALQLSVVKATLDNNVTNMFTEVPLFALVGACGGLLGATFNGTCLYMHKKRASFYGRTELDDHQRYSYKLIEVLSISLFTSASLFLAVLLSPWACRETVLEFGQENSTEERFQFMCETGQINGLFKILLGSRDDAIGSILSDPQNYDIQTLFIVGAVVYILMIISFGLAIPAGIFMPIVLSGSALGGMAGIYFQQNFLSSILPSTYALLGTAALLAGVQRNSVSLCVILIEGTGQTQALIPLIITICVANYVGGIFNEGIYEIMIELKNYSYLHHTATRSMDVVKTSDIMSYPVLCMHPIENAERIEQILLTCTHNGFPVVDKESGEFLGLVRRDQLVALLECGIYVQNPSGLHRMGGGSQAYPFSGTMISGNATTPSDNPALIREAFHITNERFGDASLHEGDTIISRRRSQDSAAEELWATENLSPFEMSNDENLPRRSDSIIVKDIRLSTDTLKKGRIHSKEYTTVALHGGKLVIFLAASEKEKMVNIAAIMNRGAYNVIEGCPLSKTYSMFTALGLRHLVVLGPGGKVSGMITRHNLVSHNLEEKLNFTLV